MSLPKGKGACLVVHCVASMHRRCALVILAIVGAGACGARTGLQPPDALSNEAGIGIDADPLCGVASCGGCCDDHGACVAGNTVDACGVGGRRCQACNARFDLCSPDPRYPDSVVCFTPCERCAGGCCSSSTAQCVTGLDDTACGYGSELCVDCSAQGLVCGRKNDQSACVPR
jgi:hypothetical protein